MSNILKKSFWQQIQTDYEAVKNNVSDIGMCATSALFFDAWSNVPKMEQIRDLACDFFKANPNYQKDFIIPSWGQMLFEHKRPRGKYRTMIYPKKTIDKHRKLRREFIAWAIENVELIHQQTTTTSHV